jgi:hypothetical protein
VLIIDVRDWTRTVESVHERPVFEKTVKVGCETLTFRSVRHLEAARGLLLSQEELSLGDRRSRATFTMRPWSPNELHDALRRLGCERLCLRAGARVRGNSTISDRIFCTAVRGWERDAADHAGSIEAELGSKS